MEYKLNCAQLRQMAPRLHAGDRVLLSGRVYTSRDAAHKRIVAAMDAGEPLPYDLQDAVIYYAGPMPAAPPPAAVWTRMPPACWTPAWWLW